jgi:presenilin-like A22 family membrane protease
MRGLRSLGLVGLYVGSQVVALLLALPFRAAGYATTSNPGSPTAPLYLIAVIVLAPIGILLVARYRGGLAAIRWVILLGIGFSLLFTLSAAFSLLFPQVYLLPPAEVGSFVSPASLLAITAAVLLLGTLLLEPHWWVVDFVGFVAAGSLIALFGISFSILPVIILLVALAIYDAIAVYGTKHMVSLAEAVTEMKLPILLVMPAEVGFDYTRPAQTLTTQRARPVEEREALFMGLGDVVFPGILVVAAYAWLPTHTVFAGIGGNLLVAVGALVGSLLGYAVLMRLVSGGNPQAGLPLLNGGALAGYLITFLLVFHSLGFGLSAGL